MTHHHIELLEVSALSNKPKQRTTQKRIVTFSTLAILALLAIVTLHDFDFSNNHISSNQIFLFKKHISKFIGIKDSPTSQTEESSGYMFDITAKFVTLHFAPVQRCKAKFVINEIEFNKEPDVNGLVQFSDLFKKEISDDKIEVVITLSSGQDENILTNTYTYHLTRSSDNPKLYSFHHQFIYQPVNPQLTKISGRVVDDSQVPLAKVPLKISYDQPVFQDLIVFQTEEDGTFEAEAQLDQLIPIFGNIVINFPPYAEWDMRRDTEFKEGFFLMNHLQFKFESDIVLSMKAIQLKVQGKVVNRHQEPLPGTKLAIDCKSPDDGTKVHFDLQPTDSAGAFSLSEKTNFQPQTKIECFLSVTPAESKYKSVKISVDMLRDNNYKIDPLLVVLTTEPLPGKVHGKVVNDLRGTPLEGITVRYETTSEDKLEIHPMKTNNKGLFEFTINGFKSEKYSGNLIFESSAFDVLKKELTLTEEDMFSADIGTVRLKEKPVPIEIILAGVFVEKTLKKVISEFPISLTITKQGEKSKQVDLKTDGEGKIEYKIQGISTEVYDIEINVKQSEEFQSVIIKKSFSSSSNFDGNLHTIEVPRQRTSGSISGTLNREEDGSPVKYARLLVTTNVKLPEQKNGAPLCKTDGSGSYECQFEVEKWLEYDATILVESSEKQSGQFHAGTLNKANEYTIRDLKSQTKLELVNKKGVISGVVKNSESNSIIDNCTYKITEISPPAENQQAILNQDLKCQSDGTFKIESELQPGSHRFTVIFSAPNVSSSTQIFLLDFPNEYKLENQTIFLGENMTGSISGIVKSKQYLAIEGATVSVEMRGRTHSTISDKSGLFSIKVPAITTQSSDKGILRVQKERYSLYEHEVEFLESKEFTITNYEVIMQSEKWKSKVSGVVVDELNVPVAFGSLSLLIKDSSRNPITQFPYSTVSDLQGQFNFDIDVTYDESFTGIISIKANYFLDQQEKIDLNLSNKYKIANKTITLQRQPANLEYSGTLMTSMRKPLPGESITLEFNEEAKIHGLTNMNMTNTKGKFRFQQKVLMGYNYKATATFKAILDNHNTHSLDSESLSINKSKNQLSYDSSDPAPPTTVPPQKVEEYVVDLLFTPENNYRLVYQEVIMRRKLIECVVNGLILEETSETPLKGAQVILDFGAGEFSDLKASSLSTESGEFEVHQKVQQGVTYSGKVTGKYPGYFDQHMNITIHGNENDCTSDKITIHLKKAEESDYLKGFIHGHAYSRTGIPVAGSEITMQFESDPTHPHSTHTDAMGQFKFDDLPCIQGNEYIGLLVLTPKDLSMFAKSQKTVILNKDNDFKEDDALVVVDRVKTTYSLKGTITDQDTKAPLGGTYVVVSFSDQLNTEGAFGYTNSDGAFDISGAIAVGLSYIGKYTFVHAGYETKRPVFSLSSNSGSKYEKSNENYAMKRNPFQKLYYLDEKNAVPIQSRVYEITKCNLFPHAYIPFVKVSLYIEGDSNHPEPIFVADTYTDENGNFTIKSPHPIFAELHIYLAFEKKGYQKLKVYQRLSTEAFYVMPGSVQINNTKGIQDCTRKERKIQNKYDHTKKQ